MWHGLFEQLGRVRQSFYPFNLLQPPLDSLSVQMDIIQLSSTNSQFEKAKSLFPLFNPLPATELDQELYIANRLGTSGLPGCRIKDVSSAKNSQPKHG